MDVSAPPPHLLLLTPPPGPRRRQGPARQAQLVPGVASGHRRLPRPGIPGQFANGRHPTRGRLPPRPARGCSSRPPARLSDDRGSLHGRITGCRASPSTDHKRRARSPRVFVPAGVVPHRPSVRQAGLHRFYSSSKILTLGTDQRTPAKPGDKIQDEQSALESQLWTERLAIQQKHQEKTKVAATKLVSFLHHLRCSHPLMEILRANLIGSGGLSQFEADVSRCLVPASGSMPQGLISQHVPPADTDAGV